MRRPASLSVLVPVYNERATIERLLTAVVSVQTGLAVEVLVGDDGSSDRTRDILSRLSLPGVKIIFMPDNVGRGGVIKHLWTLATGDLLVHQDADLEYDPQGLHSDSRSPARRPCRRGLRQPVQGIDRGHTLAQSDGEPDDDRRGARFAEVPVKPTRRMSARSRSS